MSLTLTKLIQIYIQYGYSHCALKKSLMDVCFCNTEGTATVSFTKRKEKVTVGVECLYLTDHGQGLVHTGYCWFYWPWHWLLWFWVLFLSYTILLALSVVLAGLLGRLIGVHFIIHIRFLYHLMFRKRKKCFYGKAARPASNIDVARNLTRGRRRSSFFIWKKKCTPGLNPPPLRTACTLVIMMKIMDDPLFCRNVRNCSS